MTWSRITISVRAQCRSVDQRHSNAKLAISSLFRNPEPVSRFFFSVHLSTEMRGGMSPTTPIREDSKMFTDDALGCVPCIYGQGRSRDIACLLAQQVLHGTGHIVHIGQTAQSTSSPDLLEVCSGEIARHFGR